MVYSRFVYRPLNQYLTSARTEGRSDRIGRIRIWVKPMRTHHLYQLCDSNWRLLRRRVGSNDFYGATLPNRYWRGALQ